MKQYYDFENKILTLPCFFNNKLTNLPEGVETIIFKNDNFSNYSRYAISISSKFNQPLDEGDLPDSVISLTLGHSFDQPVDHLPRKLQFLKIGDSFTKSVDNLPSTITTLILGGLFNKPVENLPLSLISLTLGYWFNQPVDNLPSGLLYLTVGHTFDKPIDKLPANLQRLTLGKIFNQSLELVPATVTHLQISNSYNYVNNIPNQIKFLAIFFDFEYTFTFRENINNLPFGLKKIVVNNEGYKKYITKIPFGCEVVVDERLKFE
jgi:hypothetical protein